MPCFQVWPQPDMYVALDRRQQQQHTLMTVIHTATRTVSENMKHIRDLRSTADIHARHRDFCSTRPQRHHCTCAHGLLYNFTNSSLTTTAKVHIVYVTIGFHLFNHFTDFSATTGSANDSDSAKGYTPTLSSKALHFIKEKGQFRCGPISAKHQNQFPSVICWKLFIPVESAQLLWHSSFVIKCIISTKNVETKASTIWH